MIKGVIIDFNGTLYYDHDINQKAWRDTFYSVRPEGSNAQYDDLDRTGIIKDGIFSRAIYKFHNIEASEEMVSALSERKEVEYRQLARDNNKNKLIDGAEDLFKYLKDHNIPYCIASMSIKSNIEFYLDYLHLDKWFTYDNIVYDDGNYNDKNSQIIEAAKRMKVEIKDCLVIEDTPINIKLASEEIGVNKFIYMNTRNIEFNSQEIIQEVKNYTEIDYKIFNN